MIANSQMTGAIPLPAVWAPAARRRGIVEGATLMRAAWLGLLIAVTVLQRFGLNFGSYSLNASLPAVYLLLLTAAFFGGAVVSPARLVLFTAGATLALLSTLANDVATSGSSLLLLLAIYFPFVFVLTPASGITQQYVTRMFLNLALVCAVAGIAQFYAQFVWHADWLFDFTRFVPAALRGPQGFNTAIPVGAHFKSNGFFFREPSGFSFMMALALMTECLSHRRWWRIGCFGLALLLTYSGTGLLALVIGMLLPPTRKSIARAVLALGAAALVFWLLDDSLNLSFTVARAGEFDSERSSGYIRYIAPLRLLADAARADPATLWLGHGPGTIFRAQTGYEFHDPTWAKLIYEYGVLGFAGFVILFGWALRGAKAPQRIRIMLFAGWLIMGGHLLSPEQNFLTLALVGLVPTDPQPDSKPILERPS
jgi:hypothetical protein